MRDGVAVAQVTLDHLAQVRSLVPQPFMALSSSGRGHHPLKVETRVRVPLGLPGIEAGGRKLEVIITSWLRFFFCGKGTFRLPHR
jgi:hypothetical protein